MKLLFALLATVAATAAHAEIGYIPNQAGGKIVLTAAPCPVSKADRYAFGFSSDGQFIEACYVLENRVGVVFKDGTVSEFTYNEVTWNPDFVDSITEQVRKYQPKAAPKAPANPKHLM